MKFCWLSTHYHTKGASTLFASKSYIRGSCLVISITEWWFIFTPLFHCVCYFWDIFFDFILYILDNQEKYRKNTVNMGFFIICFLCSYMFPPHPSRGKMTKTRQLFVSLWESIECLSLRRGIRSVEFKNKVVWEKILENGVIQVSVVYSYLILVVFEQHFLKFRGIFYYLRNTKNIKNECK